MTIRRMKTYTGGQGYVYQYYFVGKRPALASTDKDAATEYIFDVTSDRKTTFAVSVILPDSPVREWNVSHGRNLTAAEQYGAVKLRLFQGFDEIEDIIGQGRHLVVDNVSLEQALTTLGVQ